MTKRLRSLLCLAVLAMGCGGVAGDAADVRAEPHWSVSVIKVNSAMSLTPATPKLQGQVNEALQIEDAAERIEAAVAIQVRVRNRSRVIRTLRWNVARSPYLRLEDGTTLTPMGHKIAGLSESSIAAGGVLEVQIPAGESFDLYPVFAVPSLPQGAEVVVDAVGASRITPGHR